jgi:hypothetical protein
VEGENTWQHFLDVINQLFDESQIMASPNTVLMRSKLQTPEGEVGQRSGIYTNATGNTSILTARAGRISTSISSVPLSDSSVSHWESLGSSY